MSGHSLTDNPLIDNVIAIAQSLGAQLQYNEQIIIGSPIRVRTRGGDSQSTLWTGYSGGKNRDGSGMNVINELRNPQTITGGRYDALIITERHDLLSALQWEETVRFLRHFHERLIEGNSQAATYFYESWLGVTNKDDPSQWIAYERAASPVWQCIAKRVNTSLANEGRADRIRSLPAGAALAALVERVISPTGVPGITGATIRESLDRLFSDDVHLTHIGAYYMSLVNYSILYRRSAVGAWAPNTISSLQANSLQEEAWRYASTYEQTLSNRELPECRALVQTSFCSIYYTYTNRSQDIGNCQYHFSNENQTNPLYLDTSTDSSYWYTAP